MVRDAATSHEFFELSRELVGIAGGSSEASTSSTAALQRNKPSAETAERRCGGDQHFSAGALLSQPARAALLANADSRMSRI